MRQVSDLGARPLDDAPVVVDQRIGFVGQRLDFRGKFAIQPLRGALANLRQRLAHHAQRPKTEQDGDGVDRDHADAEHQQIRKEPPVEDGDFVLQLAAIAHHAKSGDTVALIQLEFAFDDLQRFAGFARRFISCCGNRC